MKGLVVLTLIFAAAAVMADDRTQPVREMEAFTEPFKVIELAAPEAGRLAVIHVQRGTRVKAGQLLVELDLQVQQAALKVAEQRASATARVEAMRVELGRKQRRSATLKELNIKGGGTAEELLNAEAEQQIAELNVRAAEEEIELHKLELKELEAQIEQRRVYSKIAGIVTEVPREVGEYVSSAEPHVITVVDLSRLRVTFFITTEKAVTLESGQHIAIHLSGRSQPVDGEIEYVGPLTQADSGRVRVDVVIDNARGELRSGLRCSMGEVLFQRAALKPETPVSSTKAR